MNQEAIELTTKKVKEYQDTQSRLESRICTYNNEIKALEKELNEVRNIKESLEAGLEKLIEAEGRAGKKANLQ